MESGKFNDFLTLARVPLRVFAGVTGVGLFTKPSYSTPNSLNVCLGQEGG
jgi:hypothetical protein